MYFVRNLLLYYHTVIKLYGMLIQFQLVSNLEPFNFHYYFKINFRCYFTFHISFAKN